MNCQCYEDNSVNILPFLTKFHLLAVLFLLFVCLLGISYHVLHFATLIKDRQNMQTPTESTTISQNWDQIQDFFLDVS